MSEVEKIMQGSQWGFEQSDRVSQNLNCFLKDYCHCAVCSVYGSLLTFEVPIYITGFLFFGVPFFFVKKKMYNFEKKCNIFKDKLCLILNKLCLVLKKIMTHFKRRNKTNNSF